MCHKFLELLIDHIDHGRKWELLWEGCLGQLIVLVGEDLYHNLVVFISVHFELVVVIVVKDVTACY